MKLTRMLPNKGFSSNPSFLHNEPLFAYSQNLKGGKSWSGTCVDDAELGHTRTAHMDLTDAGQTAQNRLEICRLVKISK